VSNQAVACPRCGQLIASYFASHRRTPERTDSEIFVDWVTGKWQRLTLGKKIGLLCAGVVVGVFWIGFIGSTGRESSTDSSATRSNAGEVKSASSQVPASNSNNENLAAINARVMRGQKIFENLTTRYHLPLAFHDATAMGFSLLLPLREWNNMSKEAQIDLSYFAEHLVSLVRQNPTKYVDGWKHFAGWPTDSQYDDFVYKVSLMCDECWDITVGEIVPGEGGKPDFEDSDVPVEAKTAEQFRHSSEKIRSKSVKEQDADRAAEFASSMPSRDHLRAAKEAMETDYDPDAKPEPKWGNTAAARSHLEAISQDAPEFTEAQVLLKEVTRREEQDRKFKEEVIRQMKRIIKERGY